MAGQPHGPDPQRVDDAISSTLGALKSYFHEQVQASTGRDDGVRPQFAILCTADPRTGAKTEGGVGVVIVIPKHFDKESDKDTIAMMLRTVAVAGEAVATIVCFDVFMAEDDTAAEVVRQGIAPSDHPKSTEAMFVAIERVGRDAQLEQHRYRRLADGIVFDDDVVRKAKPGAWGGRFAGLLPPRMPPADTVRFMREIVKAGAFGDLTWQAIQ